MNILNQPNDRTALYGTLAKNLYESVLEAIGDENESYILCMKPACNDQSEAGIRKWMGLLTLSAIINNSTSIGSLTIEEVLEANNFCTC
jgi:hypothetical protein